MINQLASNRNNTRKNPDNKQTSLVSNPEKLLKTRRYLKQTVSSTSKIYQPKSTQSNNKDLLEQSNTQLLFRETSIDRIETLETELVLPEFESRNFSNLSPLPIEVKYISHFPPRLTFHQFLKFSLQPLRIQKNILYTLTRLLLVLLCTHPLSLKKPVLFFQFPIFQISCLPMVSSLKPFTLSRHN
jgi:hypothetical protein